MNLPCPQCEAYVAIEATDRGTSMLCGNCQGVIEIPTDRIAEGMVIGGDFQIKSFIARGGMGSVYLAHRLSLDIEVAIKILHPEFSQDTEFIADFVSEARNAAQLNHPNVMQVSAVGHDQDIFYIAMELIWGWSVAEMLEQGPVELDESIRIIRKTAVALNHAWDFKNIVHRDIKPDNIMIRERDHEVKLADLGLARRASEVDNNDDEVDATPQYMCPEVMTSAPIDHRSDIYSLGATWYHMLTGRYAFEGDDPMEIARGHMSKELIPPDEFNPEVPEGISAIVVKMMAKDPSERHQTYAELINEIKTYERNEKRRKKKPVAVPSTIETPRNVSQEFAQSTPKAAIRIIVAGIVLIVAACIYMAMQTEKVDYTNIPVQPKPKTPSQTSTAGPKPDPQRPIGSTPAPPKSELAELGSIDFTGSWKTLYGTMRLQQVSNTVSGTYGSKGSLHGTVKGNILQARWKEGGAEGDVTFTLSAEGNGITSSYTHDGETGISTDWDAIRSKDDDCVPLSNRSDWALTASHKAVELAMSIDGDPATRWNSGAKQAPKMWFQVELPITTKLAGVVMDCKAIAFDVPREFKIETSVDGKKWKQQASGEGNSKVGIVNTAFKPVKAKFLRITLNAGAAPNWSIHELQLFGRPAP